MNTNEERSMVLEKIINIEEEFKELKKRFNYEEDQEKHDITEDIKRLDFIQDKLNILNIAELDKVSKEKCKTLIRDIKRFKNNSHYREYTSQIEIIEMLRDLTDTNNNYSRLEIIDKVNNILGTIRITEENLYEILDDDLVYHNKSTNELKEDEEDIDWNKRIKDANYILNNLFNMVYENYMKSNGPFDIYEKIMIINILDTVRKTLSIKNDKFKDDFN